VKKALIGVLAAILVVAVGFYAVVVRPLTESPDGAWRFELAPQGSPAHAEVIFAGDLERKDYPFRLEPNPSPPR
jgi:hypothetical protein